MFLILTPSISRHISFITYWFI